MLHSKLPLDGDLFRNNLIENCNLSCKSCRDEKKKKKEKRKEKRTEDMPKSFIVKDIQARELGKSLE